jgi:hypothetical protein
MPFTVVAAASVLYAQWYEHSDGDSLGLNDPCG